MVTMKRERRIEKFAKLRADIEQIDLTILNEIEKKKNNQKNKVIKESMKHCSSEEMVSNNSLKYSIDEILKGHTEYINIDQEETTKPSKNNKWKYLLYIFACVIFIVVFIIFVISLGGK